MTTSGGGGATGRSGLEARILSEAEYPAWNSFVDGNPAGSVYSYPEYLDALCTAVGGNFRVLAVTKGEEILGGVGLYETRPGPFKVLGNRLLLYYNGLVVREYASRYPSENTSRHLAILGALADAINEMRYHHAVLHNRHPLTDLRAFFSRRWSGRQNYSLIVGLEDPAEAFLRIEKNQRRLIKRCESAGVYLSCDDDFSSFFQMHRDTSTRKGIPTYMPEQRFEKYFTDLASQGLARLYHARLESGQSVASQLVLTGGHPITHTVTAAADENHLNQGTTPFLRWKVCEALASEGFKGNDLTDAALNPVTRFKGELGGDLVTNSVLFTKGTVAFRAHRACLKAYRRGRAVAVAPLRRLKGRRNG